MDPRELLGNPLIVAAVAAATATFGLAVAWLTYSIYRVTPELLQVQIFRKLKVLRNSVLFMGLALILGMVLITLFVSNAALPDFVWGAGSGAAAILFWYGMFGYASAFRIPRSRTRSP